MKPRSTAASLTTPIPDQPESNLSEEMSLSENEKWERYYGELPDLAEDPETRRFNTEFVEAISALLPSGGRTLEAGCGAGWQSLALARTKRFQTSLLDFSPNALSYASRLFEREGLNAQLIEADLALSGAAEFDLVFNSGVLEHYSDEDQVALVRAMKSRTKRYVIVLVPNRRCYWYWLWRYHRSVHGGWKWGKEVPVESLAHVFESAGMQFLGERHFGAAWSESFISEFFPQSASLRDEILAIHRSPVIPADQKAYLVGALGAVDQDRARVPGWAVPTAPAADTVALLTAALADALAVRNTANAAATTQPVSMEAHSGLAEAVSRLTAANAELIEQHRMAVELGQAEIAKRDDVVAHYQRQEAELTAAVARLTRTNADLVDHHHRSIENATEQLLAKEEAIEDLRRSESAALESQRQLAAAAAAGLAAHREMLEKLSGEIAARDAALRHYQDQEVALSEAQRQLANTNAALIEQYREAVERGRTEAAKRDEVIEYYRRREQELTASLVSGSPSAGATAVSAGLLARVRTAGRRWFRWGPGRSQ